MDLTSHPEWVIHFNDVADNMNQAIEIGVIYLLGNDNIKFSINICYWNILDKTAIFKEATALQDLIYY